MGERLSLALAPVLVLVLAAWLPVLSEAAATPPKAVASVAPVCATASHERLLMRAGRDICGPTLSTSGRPTAAGFLPTACPQSGQIYRIDAIGLADRCLVPIQPEN
ncbi:MAG: hypothetical protein ACK4Z7_11085 [Novosphingobium sp.]